MRHISIKLLARSRKISDWCHVPTGWFKKATSASRESWSILAWRCIIVESNELYDWNSTVACFDVISTWFNTWWRHQMETFSVLLALCEGNHRSPVDSHHKGQWRGALTMSLICSWTNGWANNRDAGDLRCHHAHYNVNVMKHVIPTPCCRSKLLSSALAMVAVIHSAFHFRDEIDVRQSFAQFKTKHQSKNHLTWRFGKWYTGLVFTFGGTM